MPIPKPSKKELKDGDKDGFVSRCISDLSEKDPDKSNDQIQAMCFDAWDSAKKKNSSKVDQVARNILDSNNGSSY